MSLSCLILAAGKGVRMKSALPKPLHQVAGRPMVSYCVAAAEALQPARIVVVIGPGMEAMADAVQPHGTALQPEAKGTGHAVQSGMAALAASDEVLVLFGDTPLVTAATLQKLRDRRTAGDNPAVVVSGMTPPSATGYGRLLVEGGSLMGIVEERDASEAQRSIKLCNGGIMLFDGHLLPQLLKGLSNNNAKGEYYLTDTIALARKAGHACAHVEIPCEEVMGVNSRVELAAVEAVMQQRLRKAVMDGGATLQDPNSVYLSHDTQLGRDVTIEPHVYFGPGVSVADGVTIRAFSHLEGVSIGKGAIIGPFARLRPGTTLSEGVHIGNFVELKKAEVAAGAKINHLSYIGDAVVGAHANIGAGTITCNYDGFGKYRTEIGAGAFIGSNTALVAPVKIGPEALVGAGSVITSDVPADALALERSPQKVAAQRGMATRRKERQ
jgi:bifunctional UDP-N-acetylglucosamine pyrophosphorylase/glucosamine-1-phosphate N-acetyltransferase